MPLTKPFPGTARFTGHRGAVYALHAAAEQDHFLSAGGDGQVVRWNLKDPANGVVLAKSDRAIFALHRSPDGLLYLGDEDGGLHVVHPARHAELRLERAHVKGIFGITDLPAGRLAVAGGDGSLSVWATGPDGAGMIALQRKIPLTDEKVRGLALDPTGQWLAVACGGGSIHILDSTTMNEQFTLPGHAIGANSVAWHPGKPVLVSGGKDGHLRLWRTDARFKPLHAFPAHKDTIYQIAFSPDGTKLATAARDKTAKLWEADTFEPIRRLDRASGGHGYSVNAVLWLGNASVVTASDDKTLVAWDLGDPPAAALRPEGGP
ncbi:MAG: hypothetical protein KBH07_06585 [Flavobacteriales bacterium]|nr:hypothetical protein [Flavobacteriales bacterium]MBP9079988.1 hypothetical protein [Flavobacteriales bacterium]